MSSLPILIGILDPLVLQQMLTILFIVFLEHLKNSALQATYQGGYSDVAAGSALRHFQSLVYISLRLGWQKIHPTYGNSVSLPAVVGPECENVYRFRKQQLEGRAGAD